MTDTSEMWVDEADNKISDLGFQSLLNPYGILAAVHVPDSSRFGNHVSVKPKAPSRAA